ncbi:hypothetical protein LSAT2_001045 [Lamellibrachia satsuma]|nr:hypothetical protein LSAT2_001045 [Lamellibrachia satsuma]
MGSWLRGAVDFPIYQDQADVNVWTLLGGNRDDVFVYNKCGRLTEHIRFPRSSVSTNAVEVAVLRAHLRDPCASVSDDVLTDANGKTAPANHPNSVI